MRAEPALRVSRLPPMTAELTLMCVKLQLDRENFGPKECNARGIGAMRRRIDASPTGGERSETGVAQVQCLTVLAQLCRECPNVKCPMKSWNITAPLS